MKQIFYRFLVLLAGICFSACTALERAEEDKVFHIIHVDELGRKVSEIWTRPRIESLGVWETSSKYFDRAMHTDGSRFSVVSFSRLLDLYKFKRGEDAVLLNCFDDYQGVLSLDDIRRYDLRLATKIKLKGFKPDWLSPLLILVPDGKNPPFQERFMTASIRELKFVRLHDYYAPLELSSGSWPGVREGLKVFKNNCLFCHSLKGRGGNKGGRLLQAYAFSDEKDREKFLADFKSFHHKDNLDKQDVEQFVTPDELESIISYLKNLNRWGHAFGA